MEFKEGYRGSADQPSGQNSSGSAGTQRSLPWVVNYGGRSRFFCPVSDCLNADVAQARGWANIQGVRNHLREHYAGRLSGAVPQAFLDAHKLCSCSVCGKIITFRSNGTCPSCRPLLRAAANNDTTEATTAAVLPSLDDVYTTRARLLKYVPRGARAVWGQALAQAAASAVWHNSAQAWTEWAMLPKCILFAPPRQGKSNKSDTVAFTKIRCERWLAGEQMELWMDGLGVRQGRKST